MISCSEGWSRCAYVTLLLSRCIVRRLERGTRLGLQPATDGKTTISHFTIKVAPFDRQALAARLRELRAEVLPSPDEPDVVRFRDNNGITVEVRVAE